MVVVGELEWVVKSVGAADVQQDFDETAASARGASDAMDEADDSTGRLSGTLGSLGGVLSLTGISTTFFSGKLGTLGGIASALVPKMKALATSILGVGSAASISGKLTAIGSAIAGSTTAVVAFAGVLGLLLGTIFTGILEKTGVLDAFQKLGNYLKGPGADAALTLISVFTAGLLPALGVIGATIVGFVRGFLDGGLTEGIKRAKTQGTKALKTFLGSWQRTIDRIKGIIDGFIDKITSIPSPGDAVSGVRDAVSGATGGGGGGGGGLLGGLPSLDTGGMIKSSGIAEVHAGETIVPAGGGGGAKTEININIDGGVGGSQAERKQAGRTIAQEIQNEFGRQI